MASDSCEDIRRTIQYCIETGQLDSSTKDQLEYVDGQIWKLYQLLCMLEYDNPRNQISLQLEPLLDEAYNGFSEVHRLLRDQDLTTDTIRKISEVLQIIKPVIIAERIKASKPSTSIIRTTEDMVKFISRFLERVYLLAGLSCIHPFTKKLEFLHYFLKFTAKENIEHEKMKDLITLAEDTAYSAAELAILCWETQDDYLARVSVPECDEKDVIPCADFVSKFSVLLESINPFRPVPRQLYISVLKVSHSSVPKRMDPSSDWRSDFFYLVEGFLYFVKRHMEDLLNLDASLKIPFPDRLQWLEIGLHNVSHLQSELSISKLEEFDPLLIPYLEALAIESATVVYTLWDVVLENNTELDHMHIPLKAKFYHLYLEIVLFENPSLKNTMMDYFQEGLTFMRTFFMDSLEQTQITDFLPLVCSVMYDANLLFNSLLRDPEEGELASENDLLRFQLLLKFKFIKAQKKKTKKKKKKFIKAAFRPIFPIISASSTSDHLMIDLVLNPPTNFESIDSYLTMLKSTNTSPSSSSLKMDEVFMGFHIYILENLLLKDEGDLKLTDADKDKRFYNGLLLLVTFVVDPPIQYIECKKQNGLLHELGTLAMEAQVALRLSYENACDSSKRRKVSLLLQLSSVALQIIKCKGKWRDRLKHKATLEAEFLDLVENVHEELIFLRSLLMNLLRPHTRLDKLGDLLMHVEVVAQKATLISNCICEGFTDGSGTREMSLLLSHYLQEVKSVNAKARDVCFQLLHESACNISVTDLECFINVLLDMLSHLHSWDDVISSVRNQIPVVQEQLKYLSLFLADSVQHRNMHIELKDLMHHVRDVTDRAKYVVFFSVSGDSRAWFHQLYLFDVKQVLNLVEPEVRAICSRVPITHLSFPKTNGLGFIQCFLGKLEELLHSKLDLITELKPQIEPIKKGLLCLRSFFDNFSENYDEDDEVYGLITSSTEIAYKAEYVIDFCLASSNSSSYRAHCISEVVENIKLVTKDVSENCGKRNADVNQVAKGFSVPTSSANTPGAVGEMVGFQDAVDKLKLQLLGGSHQLDVTSIYGMPGLGKTTLAKKIYNDPAIGSHFDVRAMCCVTQVYSQRELLLSILNEVLEPADRSKKEDSELANDLRRFLLTKRFLILIDDVWDKAAWDDLYMCFRDAQNRSRIILTTRLYEVADYAKCKSEPHKLRLLTDDESWNLLQEELFHGKSCPPELGDVGLQIAKSCGGLPLFIVLVAGVLKEKTKNADSWKEVEESLGSRNIGSSEEGMSIIGFSYKNLPHYLKPCFLYFGGFLKGKDIPLSKLSRVWSAEGFLAHSKETGAENATQDYLKDLIRRNLVMNMEKRSNEELKTCRVHDLLHQFCVEKAKQDNFLLWIHREKSGHSVPYPEKPAEYRLSVYSKRSEFATWLPSESGVRSLLFNATKDDYFPAMARDISFIFEKFKLVKVLDLESVNIGDIFPAEIKSLVHMRYFAARTGANSIPSSVVHLWNLETFIVRGLRGELKLPCSLLNMFKLRHIHVNSRASFSLHDETCESVPNSRLFNLETFSSPCLSYGEDAEKILRNMPNLRKLRCIFKGSLFYSKKLRGNCVFFPRLDFLNQLESLKLLSNSIPTDHPHEFNFPSGLRELTLSKFRLPWTQISAIAELPNLEILKLLLGAFEGDHWEVKDSDFPELKYLKLDNLNIAQWSVSDDAFPKLERLVLTKCKQLEVIPSHFEDVASLESIEVNWCSWSVANSAQEIQTTQREDMVNDAFTVTIQPPDWARRSSH